MLSHDHFQKNKLKYVIVCVLLILLIVLIQCYCNKKERFSNKEGFTNKMITDVLLGKKFDNKKENRVNLSDNINENNQLDIIYSTYYIQPIIDNNNNNNNKNKNYKNIHIFLRTNVNNNSKIIGDLIFEINEKKLSYNNNNDIILNDNNVPHLLNPELKKTNALELTETDIKKDSSDNKNIIEKDYSFNTDNNVFSYEDSTLFLLKLIGIKEMKDIYKNNNMKKIYDFFNKGKTDFTFLSKNNTQILNELNYSNNSNKELFKIIQDIKYKEQLKIYYDYVNDKTSSEDYSKSQIAIILSDKIKEKINTINVNKFAKRIYSGYSIPNMNYTIPFTMSINNKQENISNNNKYLFKNNVLKKLKYEKPEISKEINILIEFYDIYIDEIILFTDTMLETKFYIPYLETNFDYTKTITDIEPTKLNLNNSSLISSIKNQYDILEKSSSNDKLIPRINNFKNKINYILNDEKFFLNLPLRIIRMKDPTDDDTHVIFGDILDTGNIINTENNILSNYVKYLEDVALKQNIIMVMMIINLL